MPLKAWVSKRLDFSFGDWLFALWACSSPTVERATERVEGLWLREGQGMVGLSVRSLFDLYLKANRWAPGDRIVFTALTVADMPRIAREHDLEVASVDLDPHSTEPDIDALAAVMTPRTRALVFTHLYGARVDVSAAMAMARGRGVHFVEDCAEAYAGPGWRGHANSDLTLFSFGPIKTATAFGGGLALVADPDLLTRMKEAAADYPVQSRSEYLQRVIKYGLLGIAGIPSVFGPLVTALAAVGLGHDTVLHRWTRGFSGPELFPQIRRRPSDSLLRLLERRLRQGDSPSRRRVGPAAKLVSDLGDVPVPTAAARPHAYWLIPVRVPDPDALVDRLERGGFNATRGRAFEVVENDESVDAREPVGARALHEGVVFLPFSPQMSATVLARLAQVVRDEFSRQES
jgi:perosamine synthetase